MCPRTTPTSSSPPSGSSSAFSGGGGAGSICPAVMANAANSGDVEGSVRLAVGGGRSGYADVPGFRQRGNDHWDHANYRRHAAAHELRRLVGDHHPVGGGPVAIDLRPGARLSSVEGPRTALLDTNVRRAPPASPPARPLPSGFVPAGGPPRRGRRSWCRGGAARPSGARVPIGTVPAHQRSTHAVLGPFLYR